MKVLLVTGAGASRNLGPSERSMPLMANWADALCSALDDEERGLAAACHLTPGMDGPAFEENLGLLLRWDQVRGLDEEFLGLGGKSPGVVHEAVRRAGDNVERRMRFVREAVNRTLYDLFGQRQVDDERAATAYGSLLQRLGEPEIIVATTNYDRTVETALESLGHDVDTGFRSAPHRAPVLSPAGLIAERGNKTPVIHLHGAVGWYESEGSVRDHYADLGYNPTLGAPVVLYPDPDKDPTSDAIVSQLWLEFRAALREVDVVMVMGHSLHDPALVDAIRSVPETPVLVTFINDKSTKFIASRLPLAQCLLMRFGPRIESTRALKVVIEELMGEGKEMLSELVEEAPEPSPGRSNSQARPG